MEICQSTESGNEKHPSSDRIKEHEYTMNTKNEWLYLRGLIRLHTLGYELTTVDDPSD